MNPRASAFVAISEHRTHRTALSARAARSVALLDEQSQDDVANSPRAPIARLSLFATSICALFRR